MVFRLIEALVGAVLAAAGGYFAWINRGSVEGMFPPTPGQSIWLFVGGLVALIAGAVTVVHALGPRPKAKAKRVEEEERRARLLKQAEQFYTARAEELARGDPQEVRFPEGLRPSGMPAPTATPPRPNSSPPPESFRSQGLGQPPIGSARPSPPSPPPQTEPAVAAPKSTEATVPPPPPSEPALSPPSPAVSPPATTPALESAIPLRPFPGPTGTIPRATELPPAISSQPSLPPAPSPVTDVSAAQPEDGATSGAKSFEDIRGAISENRLEEADRMLTETRKRLNESPDTQPIEIALLTGLAGDHAAADGRLGSAKWLWRLALQRFAAAGAIDDPAARAVSERMRLADQ